MVGAWRHGDRLGAASVGGAAVAAAVAGALWLAGRGQAGLFVLVGGACALLVLGVLWWRLPRLAAAPVEDAATPWTAVAAWVVGVALAAWRIATGSGLATPWGDAGAYAMIMGAFLLLAHFLGALWASPRRARLPVPVLALALVAGLFAWTLAALFLARPYEGVAAHLLHALALQWLAVGTVAAAAAAGVASLRWERASQPSSG